MVQRRRQERLMVDLPVRVWGMDAAGKPFTVAARTIDLTGHGVRVKGVPPVAENELLGVQYEQQKNRFRVVWSGQVGTPLEGQAGLAPLDEHKNIWGNLAATAERADQGLGRIVNYYDDAPATSPAATSPAATSPAATSPAATSPAPSSPPAATVRATEGVAQRESSPILTRGGSERRMATRFPCRGTVEFREDGSPIQFGTLVDISLTGIYAQSTHPLRRGTAARIIITTDGFEICCDAESRVCHEGVGCGMMFLRMSVDDRQRLTGLLGRLSMAGSVMPPPADQPNAAAAPEAHGSELATLANTLALNVRDFETQARMSGGDPGLIDSFRSAAEQMAHCARTIQQWMDQTDVGADTSALFTEVAQRRMKYATGVLREMVAHLDSEGFNPAQPGATDLFATAVQLYKRLAALAARRTQANS